MERPLLIYDGDCPMCLRARDWIAERVPAGEIELIPCQDARREALAPQVSYEDCMQAMQLVLPSGEVLSGAAAFPPILRRIPGWGWAGALMGAPGLRHVSPLVYAVIARNRMALSGLFKKRAAGESCSIEKGCD